MNSILSPLNLSSNIEIDNDIIFTSNNLSNIDIYVNNNKIIESGVSLYNNILITSNEEVHTIKHNIFKPSKINIITLVNKSNNTTESVVFKTVSSIRHIVNFYNESDNIYIDIKSKLYKLKDDFTIILNNKIINNEYIVNIIKYDDYTIKIIISEKFEFFKQENDIILYITDENNNTTTYSGKVFVNKITPTIKKVYHNIKNYEEYDQLLQFIYTYPQGFKKEDIIIKYKDGDTYKYIYYDGNIVDSNFNVDINIDKFIILNLDTSNVFIEKLNLIIELADILKEEYIFFKRLISRVDFIYNKIVNINDDIYIHIIQKGSSDLVLNTFNLYNNNGDILVNNGEILDNSISLYFYNNRYIKLKINKNRFNEDITLKAIVKDIYRNIYEKDINIIINKEDVVVLDIIQKTGKYNKDIVVNIKSNFDGIIYYTLDGSDPDEKGYTTLYKYTTNKEAEIQIYGDGIWILKAKLITFNNKSSKVYTETYDISKDKPQIYFDNINDGDIFDTDNIILQYRIVNNNGLLTKILLIINDYYYDISNNNNQIPIKLIDDINIIKIIVYNNYGNYSEKQIKVYKKTGYLKSIKIKYADIYDIKFPDRKIKYYYNNNYDYHNINNICIIGYGTRREILFNGYNGSFGGLNFRKNSNIDRRHFYINSKYLPILENSFNLYIINNNNIIKLKRRYLNDIAEKGYNEYCYLLDENNGYVVLDYPIEDGMVLYCEYIPKNNINTMYTFYNIDEVYEYYGRVNKYNTISIAAEILFRAGASIISVIQLNPFIDDKYDHALLILEKYNPYLLLPAINDSDNYNNIVNKIIDHCDKMSFIINKGERITLGAYIYEDIINIKNSDRFFSFIFNYNNRDIYYFDGVENIKIDVSYALFSIAVNYINNLGKLYINNNINKFYKFKNDNIIKINNKDILDNKKYNNNIIIDNGNLLSIKSIVSKNGVYDLMNIITIDYIQIDIRRKIQDIYIGSIINDDLLLKISKTINDILVNHKKNTLIREYKIKNISINQKDSRQVDINIIIILYNYLNSINLSLSVFI